jgi:hypothetical protein
MTTAPPTASAAAPVATSEQEEDEENGTAPTSPTGYRRRTLFPTEPCASSLAQCPLDGCEDAGAPHALVNHYKRRTTDANGRAVTFDIAVPITIANMVELQASAEAVVPKPEPHQELTPAQRDKLKKIAFAGLAIGEGTAVRVAGYVAPPHHRHASAGVHEGASESVNCRVPKPADAPAWTVHDFHIPITTKPITANDSVSECNGVVVEMIPQGRAEHPHWLLETLKDVARRKQLVMFVGPLLYDNEHVPNPDCRHLVPSQPKRASLWEIHPVTEFYVCSNGDSCGVMSKAGWEKVD